ncbi:TlyA family RNA methyltransferase [Chitinibacter bivalviorum]|uniref:TlyA family RNA methyltransferase n=1 Tax=Chitinibacter bivalviorum TaxID=2739434 RepID=A0A7H9BK37_9NEIS|nr:TlyA family RNA methyltransferase [Chitinibacter bivalviorum]QLG88849.1 TlyA family RNA methyltransferase [Chitinibacter bivalviorum]
MSLQRADLFLVEQGLASSRTQAQTMIAAGRVFADGKPITKAAFKLDAQADITITPDEVDRYVSRGGLKLAGALTSAQLDVSGMLALDVGISTGGFSDCLLQSGARKVIGVEVGHDQLHPRLLADARVVQFEGVNARHLTPELIAPAVVADSPDAQLDLVVGDVSFISLTLVLPALRTVLPVGGLLLFLVKPQFELGPQALGKGGIVRDEALYPLVEDKIKTAAVAAGFELLDYFASPIAGGDGNREFFIYARAV